MRVREVLDKRPPTTRRPASPREGLSDMRVLVPMIG